MVVVLYIERKYCSRNSSTLYSSLIIVISLQLRGLRQIAEPRKYCLMRVIVFFSLACVFSLFFLFFFLTSWEFDLISFTPFYNLSNHLMSYSYTRKWDTYVMCQSTVRRFCLFSLDGFLEKVMRVRKL